VVYSLLRKTVPAEEAEAAEEPAADTVALTH
jgi:hypothetical protein